MGNEIHQAAREGYAVDAKSYARGRPEYPAELAGWLADELGVLPGSHVVDLGAGTGKFTKRLLANGATVTAVEPVDAMRAELAAGLPGVAALVGAAASMPLQTAIADVVVCAQAFHWFAGEVELKEIHRVLRPGGRLGLVWNVRDESVDWVAELTRIITPYEGDAPRFYKGDWRRPFDASPYFDLPAPSSFVNAHVGTPEEVIVDRILSVSFIATLEPEEKAKVARRLRRLVAEHPALSGHETVAFPYRTEAYCCSRR
ncbi:class I SAM-dependent methyltransferase [Paucibacter sp. R3-3]|uniref:Class I SAM-dependent methyltransferase n=1 Tax=Roseateles agri TaxID=3098619 RepID=A0ABU5DKF5_9BURK|nr:class I SAM-dependent methyltransferase [Paucibacter sp. R3-3]MDY0746783.1 class I SAM-dependent methyltransferase [Paucibacter sp. R3-3]